MGIVVRKKHDLIRRGLSSELFLLALLRPDNARKLGQRLQNTTKTPSNYSKVHPTIQNLTISKHLRYKDDKKFHVNIERLVEDLELVLQEKKKKLTEKEKKTLVKFLQSKDLFKFLEIFVMYQIQKQKKSEHNLDALTILSDFIGQIATGILLLKKIYGRKLKIDKDVADEISKLIDEKFEEKFREELVKENINEKFAELSLNVFKSLFQTFQLVPQSLPLLRKISLLSAKSESMITGFETALVLSRLNDKKKGNMS